MTGFWREEGHRAGHQGTEAEREKVFQWLGQATCKESRVWGRRGKLPRGLQPASSERTGRAQAAEGTWGVGDLWGQLQSGGSR